MDMSIFKLKSAFAVVLILLVIFLSPFRISAQDILGHRNTLNLWDAVDGTLLRTIETEPYIYQARLNRDGTMIVALHDNGSLVSYDAQSGNILHTRTFGSPGDYRDLWEQPGFVPSQVFVFQNNQFWLWDFVTDEIVLTGTTENRISTILVSPDGQRFLVSTRQGQITIFDAASGDMLISIPSLPRIWDIQWSLDGARIAVAHKTGFNVFDGETGASLFDMFAPFEMDVYASVSWNPDGTLLLPLIISSLQREDTELRVIESDTWAQRYSIPFDSGVYSLNWDTDGSRMLVASYKTDGVSSYNAQTGKLIRSYAGDLSSPAGFLSAGWNYDDSLVVGKGPVAPALGSMYAIWDAETGRIIQEQTYLGSLVDVVWNVAATHVLFTVWPDSIVDVIDLTQPDAPRFTLVHQDILHGATWSADGNRILTWTGENRG
jgi:WD40 repeat protein